MKNCVTIITTDYNPQKGNKSMNSIRRILPVLLAVLGLGQVIGSRDEKRKGKDAVSIAGMLLNAAEILLMILSGQPYR